MTPEDKRNIHEEEKERHEAQEKLKKESKKKQTKKGCIGCFSLVFISVIIGLIAGVFTSNDKDSFETKNIRVSTSDDVNIRTGPSVEYEVDEYGPLFKGEKLYVIENSKEWIRFTVAPDDTSWTGWVKKDLTVPKSKWDADKFLNELRTLENSLGVNLIEGVTVSKNKATIKVTNIWHLRNKQLRLQDAQTLWKIWANINNPSEPDKARIEIVDINGNEVGGSGFLGGSDIEVDD